MNSAKKASVVLGGPVGNATVAAIHLKTETNVAPSKPKKKRRQRQRKREKIKQRTMVAGIKIL